MREAQLPNWEMWDLMEEAQLLPQGEVLAPCPPGSPQSGGRDTFSALGSPQSDGGVSPCSGGTPALIEETPSPDLALNSDGFKMNLNPSCSCVHWQGSEFQFPHL